MTITETRNLFRGWHGQCPTLDDMDSAIRRRPSAPPLDLSPIHPDLGAQIERAVAKYGLTRDAIMMAELSRIGLAAGRFVEVDPGAGWSKIKPNAVICLMGGSGDCKTQLGKLIDTETLNPLKIWTEDFNAKEMKRVKEEAAARDLTAAMIKLLEAEQRWREPRCVLNRFTEPALLGFCPNSALAVEWKELRAFWASVQPGHGKPDMSATLCTLLDEYEMATDLVGGPGIVNRGNVRDASVTMVIWGQQTFAAQFFTPENIDSGLLGRVVLLPAVVDRGAPPDYFEFEDYFPVDMPPLSIFNATFKRVCEKGFKREAAAGASAGIARTTYTYGEEARELKRYSDGIFKMIKQSFAASNEFLWQSVKTKWVSKLPAMADKYALLYQIYMDNSPLVDENDMERPSHIISRPAVEFGFQIACLAYNNWSDLYASVDVDIESLYKQAKQRAKTGQSARSEVRDYAARVIDVLGGPGPWTLVALKNAIERLWPGKSNNDKSKRTRIKNYLSTESEIVHIESSTLGDPKITFVI